MSKKVIVLNGSPRTNGNTAALVDAFISGAEEAGHTVTRFDLQKMTIHPCLGCLGGGKDPQSPCTQKDDMDKIYGKFKEADILVFASPMYCWSFSAQLKAVIDRIFAVMEIDPNYIMPYKESIMLMAAGEDNASNFEPAVSYYKSFLKRLGWKNLGFILAGGVLKVGDIHGKPALKEAKKLGASMA